MQRVIQSTDTELIVTHYLSGKYELAYLWRPNQGNMSLCAVELRLGREAKALYRPSPQYPHQLVIDIQASGPTWFLDELPLQFQSELRPNGRLESDLTHLIQQAEKNNQAAIAAWMAEFTGISPNI